MRVSDVLRHKGATVHTVRPDVTVRALVAMLAEHHVGALVVSPDGEHVDGIVSERDIVRGLARSGDAVLEQRVASIMTATVYTAEPSDLVSDLAAEMTERRIRHVPVCVDHKLAGIVSIGDVVKQRIDELLQERDQLEAYISS
jgi:CBS domain-containing protein